MVRILDKNAIQKETNWSLDRCEQIITELEQYNLCIVNIKDVKKDNLLSNLLEDDLR